MPKKYRESGQSSIAWQQSVTFNKTTVLSASNTLVFVQPTSSVSHILVSAESTLTFAHEATLVPIHDESASDVLNFQQSVAVIRPTYLNIEHTLDFAQSAYNSIKALSVESVLSFSQDVDVKQPILVSVTSLLIFDDEVSTGQNIISRNVTSYLSFSDLAIKTAQILTVSNHLQLSHEVDTRKFHEKPSSILYFSHIATVEQTSPASSDLEFEQLLYCYLVTSPSLISQLEFTQTASAVIQDQSQWSEAPTLVRRATMRLTWPYDSPILTLEIPAPEFNNQETFNTRRVNRKSRGGTLDIFRDPSWPSVRNFDFRFEWLSDDQRYAMLDFLDRSLGEEIGVLDFESRQWRGIILTPSSEIADAGPCKHGVEIAFEGDLV